MVASLIATQTQGDHSWLEWEWNADQEAFRSRLFLWLFPQVISGIRPAHFQWGFVVLLGSPIIIISFQTFPFPFCYFLYLLLKSFHSFFGCKDLAVSHRFFNYFITFNFNKKNSEYFRKSH